MISRQLKAILSTFRNSYSEIAKIQNLRSKNAFLKNQRQKWLSAVAKSFLRVVWCSKLYQKIAWTLNIVFHMHNVSRKCIEQIVRRKNEVQSIFGFRHLTHLSHQIFTWVFWPFFAKFLTSEQRRKFSTHVMMMFWLLKICSRMRAIQRILNQCHSTRRKFVDPQFWISGKNSHLSWLLILTFRLTII